MTSLLVKKFLWTVNSNILQTIASGQKKETVREIKCVYVRKREKSKSK